MRIVWVATKCPWPPTDGGRLVLRYTVEALAARGERVTVVCPGRAEDDPRLPGVRLRAVPGAAPSRSGAAWASLRLPAAIARHATAALAREAERAIAEETPEVVFAEQIQALPACRAAFRSGAPVVLRAQNVESDLWSARAGLAGPAAARLFRFEARRLERWEGAAVARCAAAVALTIRDADRLGALSGRSVSAVPAPFPALLPLSERRLPGNPAIVMLASRGWWANEDGAGWFLREVWPVVSARRRDARLHLFGARPPGELPAGVAGHPAPEDSREAFSPESLFVVALRAASGVRMKILESWARGVPVVSTPAAAAGLESAEGLRIAASPEEFAAAVDELARDPAAVLRLVESGRRDLARFHDPAAVAERLSGIAAAAAGGRHVPASTADRRSPA